MALSVAVVVLAAGRSSRMGSSGGHKLLATFEGVPLVRRTVLAALGSVASPVIVVTGHRRMEIEGAIADLDMEMVCNENYQSGIAGSIACGVAAAESVGPDGLMIMLADMPELTAGDLDRLVAAFDTCRGTSIVRAAGHGRPGNPVIFPQSLHARLTELSGDSGARQLIETAGIPVVDLDLGERALIDVDTPEEVTAAGGLLRPSGW